MCVCFFFEKLRNFKIFLRKEKMSPLKVDYKVFLLPALEVNKLFNYSFLFFSFDVSSHLVILFILGRLP